MPIHVTEVMQRVQRAQRELHQQLGRPPTRDEVAAAACVEPARVAQMLHIALEPVSLHAPIWQLGDYELGDVIEDVGSPAPEDAAAASLLRANVEGVLAALDDREAEVIRLRYGLRDGQGMTLDEVGELFGVTRERVRQIEAKALAQLRRARGSEHLREYLV